ncbi:MAG: hypothetical protein EBU90_04820 [Proteobacteria bacterium]|nr:hypothetical protein [Pseudomonadota bacterium]NBP13759.1 hypothetical protein [bacterium]
MSYCAPNIDVSENWTCFERKELQEIAMAFNIYIQTNRVCQRKSCIPGRLIDIHNKSKQELWKSIYRRLSKICKDEYCWSEQSFINAIPDPQLREKIKYFTFKPRMTRGRRSWLSTSDINAVMQQYQEMDKSFKFLGALPSDFYTQVKVRWTDIHKYKRIGVVFNLDTHDQPGSHWTAFLIDNIAHTLEYFDSAAKPPNKHIQRFIEKLRHYVPGYTYLENKKQHQRQNNECGVYAIYFLVQRLLGNDFNTISNNIVTDRQMNLFRDVIFRPR